MRIKRYLLMPLETAPLLLAGLLAVVQTAVIMTGLGGQTGILVLPFVLIFASWFFKYCYALLDALAAGEREPPVLSYEMINPLNEQRPLVQLGIVALGAWATWAAWHHLAPAAGAVTGAVLLLALPATIALLSMGEHWYLALWPPALVRVVLGMGPAYLLALGITLGAAAFIGALLLWFLSSIFMVFLLAQLALLLVFSVIGGAIFERRVELGFDTASVEERQATRDQRDRAVERSRMLDKAYASLRLKRRADAWNEVQQWITVHCAGSDGLREFQPLLAATSCWDDGALADRLASVYLDRLLAAGQSGMAVDVLAARLAANPGFRPATTTTTVRLVELARFAGRSAVSRQLEANAGGSGAKGERAR